MTITEKILAKHAGRREITPGESVWVDVDVLMTHDVCGPGTVGIFQQEFGKRRSSVWDPDRVVIVPDHYIFTADLKSYRNVQLLRQFVKDQGLRYYYDPDFIEKQGMPSPYLDPTKTSYKGVCHKALPEEGPRAAGRDPARHGQHTPARPARSGSLRRAWATRMRRSCWARARRG